MREPSTKDNRTYPLVNPNVILNIVGVAASRCAGTHLNIRKLPCFSRGTDNRIPSSRNRGKNVLANKACYSHYLDDTAQVQSLTVNKKATIAITLRIYQPVCSATLRGQDVLKPGQDDQ